jgi:vacuolar protein sorting-associated protein 13A/C
MMVLQSVELESLALYFDSDRSPWSVDKPWEDLLPSEWSQVAYSCICNKYLWGLRV